LKIDEFLPSVKTVVPANFIAGEISL